MDLSLITGAAGALKTAVDIGRAAVDIRDNAKIGEAVVRMNEQLLNAQQSLFVHSAQLAELQQKYLEATQELTKVKETLAQRGRYSLFEIVPGQFVYRVDIRPESAGAGNPGGAEPEHYVCQPCFDGPELRRVVLRRIDSAHWGRSWKCPVCDAEVS